MVRWRSVDLNLIHKLKWYRLVYLLSSVLGGIRLSGPLFFSCPDSLA